MRQQKNIAFFLAGCLLLSAFAGCGKNQTNASSESAPVSQDSPAVESVAETSPENSATSANTDKKMLITIDTVEVTMDELKEQDYKVTLYVTLEKNAGISYSEWGLSYDERCEMSASKSQLDYNTVYAFNAEKPFLWTAWSGGAEISDYETPVLRLTMTLPEDAGIGDFYPVTYASTSLANTPHKWSDGKNDWVALDEVAWNDGGVKVVVSPD